MEINLKPIPIGELVADYADNKHEGGVVGYHGNLDIRPKYQRNFVYTPDQRAAVIDTLMKSFPLNVMYWADNGDGRYEVIDGQQRILSICQYCTGKFSVVRDDRPTYFHTLTDDEQAKIKAYELMVYFCRGKEDENLAWFRTINIAGAKLYDQELRNAAYCGEWVTDAKRYFSRQGCPAQDIGGAYLTAAANRQEILETAIRWISEGNIEDYMADHRRQPSAKPLWDYFEGVIDWVAATFPKHRAPMKGVPWGELHRTYHTRKLDPDVLEEEVARLMWDKDIKNKSGIYSYVLTRKEKHLNLRRFDDSDKVSAYEAQGGKCAGCGEEFPLAAMQGDHITPWSAGGENHP